MGAGTDQVTNPWAGQGLTVGVHRRQCVERNICYMNVTGVLGRVAVGLALALLAVGFVELAAPALLSHAGTDASGAGVAAGATLLVFIVGPTTMVLIVISRAQGASDRRWRLEWRRAPGLLLGIVAVTLLGAAAVGVIANVRSEGFSPMLPSTALNCGRWAVTKNHGEVFCTTHAFWAQVNGAVAAAFTVFPVILLAVLGTALIMLRRSAPVVAPGWYSSVDPYELRFWDGQTWRGTMRWTGRAWVQPAVVFPSDTWIAPVVPPGASDPTTAER